MNILCDTLPSFVEIDGEKYELNTDFKVWIKFHSIMCDKKLSNKEKFVLAIINCFNCKTCKKLPPNAESTLNAIIKFYGGNTKEEKENTAKSNKKKLFDFEEDAELIFSAFYMEYGIDLTETKIHWHKFLALFRGMGDNNQFARIVSYRGINLDEIEDKTRRNFYAKMKKKYALSSCGEEPLAEGDIAEKLSQLF